METLEKDFPLIEIVDTLESEDNDEICYGAVKELLEREKDLTGICFAGAGNVGGIQAILDSKRKLKIVTYDLTEEIRGYLKNGIVTATICQDPYKQGYDGIDLMGKYLLWNELPVEECYFTDLSIVTKYSV